MHKRGNKIMWYGIMLVCILFFMNPTNTTQDLLISNSFENTHIDCFKGDISQLEMIEFAQSHCPFFLTTEDIAPAGEGGAFTITESGYYILCDDVVITSTLTGSLLTTFTAITIDADNVTFDMNNKSITNTGSDPISGIAIESHSNITIKNGSLVGFNGIVGAAFGFPVGAGAFFINASDNIIIDSIYVSKTTSDSTVKIIDSTCCTIKNSTFNNNTALGSTYLIILIQSSSGTSSGHIIQDCTFGCNTSPVDAFFAGMFITSTNSSIIKNCKILNNHGSGGAITFCMLISGADNFHIYGNKIIGNTSDTGGVVAMQIDDGCDNCVIENNFITGNRTLTSGDVTGISDANGASSTNLYVKNFLARNASVSGTSFGFNLQGNDNAFGNKSYGHTSNYDMFVHRVNYTLGTGTGFGVAESATEIMPFNLLANVEFT